MKDREEKEKEEGGKWKEDKESQKDEETGKKRRKGRWKDGRRER